MDISVIVIGAGSTGLLLAQGLKQSGIRATVYEREEPTTYQKRPREWGMTLHWGAPFIATCIPPSLRASLNESVCCDPYHAGKDLSLPHFNGKTGEKLIDTPGHEPRRISRKKFRNFLSQGIQIEYGKRLQSIQKLDNGTVTARFTDETSVTASCIVGCDGAHSAVRTCLVGEEAAKVSDLDIQMFNVCCSFPRELSLQLRSFGHPVFKNSYHPAGVMWWQSIQSIEDPNKPETWLWQNIISWHGSPRPNDLSDQASRLKYWKEVGEDFAEPWRSVARALPGDLQFGVDKTSVWSPFNWSESPLAGAVTLAGDAAHCMPAHRGQGLNNALEDAAKLIQQFELVKTGNKPLKTAIEDFEDEMRTRANTEIPISVRQARAAHDFDQLMNAPMFKIGLYKSQEEMAKKDTEESRKNV